MNDIHPQSPVWAEAGRIARLTRKELRETLRDRRTVITLVLMPLLVYPLISISFNKSVLVGAERASKVFYAIAVRTERDRDVLLRLLDWGEELMRDREAGSSQAASTDAAGSEYLLSANETIGIEPMDGPLESLVADNRVHVAVRIHYSAEPGDQSQPLPPVACELIYRANAPASRRAMRFVDDRLRLVNERALQMRLAESRRWAGVPAAISHRVVATGHAAPFSLATLVPLVLILMTITGAVYPAIDLTAGERERGTLETLIAAPISRMALLLAKYIAVLTVAVLTALVNLIAMTVTIMSSSLREQLFPEGMSVTLMAEVFALMVLFATFFSAILLALTSVARSFKEAQAYLIPVMLLAISPGLLSLMPGLQLSGLLAVVPLVNIVLLSRDLLEASITPSAAVLAIVSTMVYAVGALVLASKIFGHDALLYASRGSWSDLLRRPTESRAAPSIAATLACMACMFPCFFLIGNAAARYSHQAGVQLTLYAAVSVVVFCLCPLIFAAAQRVRLAEGYQLRWPPLVTLLGAAVLGVALWPLAYELFLVGKLSGLVTVNRNRLAEIEQLLDAFQGLSPVLVLATLALVQPLCEEFFFRGYLMSGLRERLSGAGAVIASSLLFGLFHVLNPATLTPERFLPSTFLGLFLGWLCYRTGSVLPGMVAHAIHNGLLLVLVQHRDWAVALGWNVEGREHLPWDWLAVSAGVTLCGIVLVCMAARYPREARRP